MESALPEDGGNIPKTIRRLIEEKGSAVSTISPDDLVVDAARVMAEEKIGVLVCCDDPTVVSGVISERDIVRVFAEHPEGVGAMLVHDVMTKDVKTCHMDDDIALAMAMMKQGGFRHLPIVDDGRLRALISATDILMFYMKYANLNDRQTILAIILESGLVYPGG
ncbi:MAG: CBS domain-containing protein [Rhodospirillales bacterium]